ncbi:hypothetical protein IFR05_010946 [Cadophora sp. M221]|nr:hypothetical protein IFR05_010946 [Cadophora sp. M221]
MNNEIPIPASASLNITLRLLAKKPVRPETQVLQEPKIQAALADVVGLENIPKCSRCQNGGSFFQTCSSPDDIFDGACASCYWYGLASECSFHDSFLPSDPVADNDESTADVATTQFRSSSPALQGSTTSQASPASTPRRAAAHRRARGRPIRKVQQRGGFDFRRDILKGRVFQLSFTSTLSKGEIIVQKSVNGGHQMTRQLLQAVIDYMNDMFHQIAQEAGKLAAMNRRKTIKKDDIKFA